MKKQRDSLHILAKEHWQTVVSAYGSTIINAIGLGSDNLYNHQTGTGKYENPSVISAALGSLPSMLKIKGG